MKPFAWIGRARPSSGIRILISWLAVCALGPSLLLLLEQVLDSARKAFDMMPAVGQTGLAIVVAGVIWKIFGFEKILEVFFILVMLWFLPLLLFAIGAVGLSCHAVASNLRS